MATRISWPAIPTKVEGAGGPITVKRVKRATSDDGQACWGTWQADRRVICLDRYASREHQHRTLFHELMHATLDDAGLAYLLTDQGNEAICDAVATSRMQELRATLA